MPEFQRQTGTDPKFGNPIYETAFYRRTQSQAGKKRATTGRSGLTIASLAKRLGIKDPEILAALAKFRVGKRSKSGT